MNESPYFVNPDLAITEAYYWCQYVGTAQQRTTASFGPKHGWFCPWGTFFLHHLRFFEDLIEYVAWDVELYIWSEHYICQWLIVERLLGAEKGRIANCVKRYYRRKYTHYTGVGRGNFVQQLTSFVAFPLTKPAITHDSATRYQMDYMDIIFPLIPLSFL